MKFAASLLALASAVVAAPVARQSQEAITDQLLFEISLPEFSDRRGSPSELIWETDGCTSSPDNPFGFPFIPACHRHDFGYHNYRAQSRFTVSNKKRIDDNFKDDLYYQCDGVTAQFACEGLAEVYYAAVRAFGGDDATPDVKTAFVEDLEVIYEEKVAEYEVRVKKAQDEGLLPSD
jgi:hypothetical protein